MFVSPYPRIYSIHLGCAGQIHGACSKHLSKLTWIQQNSAGPRGFHSLSWIQTFLLRKEQSYQDYYPTTFLINVVSPINCESKLWWEKLTVKHLFGKPSFSANNNVWFIQFHKTTELQLFLPKGLEVYMEYFQGRGRGWGCLWRLSFCGSWLWSRLKAFVRWVQSIKSIYRCKWTEIRDWIQWVVYESHLVQCHEQFQFDK